MTYNIFFNGIIIVSLMIATLCIGIAVGEISGKNLLRNEAVIKGHAHWVPNEIGAPRFQWRE